MRVETTAQAETLHGLGCDQGQGFLLGRPTPDRRPRVPQCSSAGTGSKTFPSVLGCFARPTPSVRIIGPTSTS